MITEKSASYSCACTHQPPTLPQRAGIRPFVFEHIEKNWTESKILKDMKLIANLNMCRNEISFDKTSLKQVVDYVGNGEKSVNSLYAGQKLPRASIEDIRALTWYLFSRALQQKQVLLRGSIRFKDPEHRIYSFLKSHKGSYRRISTHYRERSAGPRSNIKSGITGVIGCILGHQRHYGLEDYECYLPVKMGSVLFGKLKDGETFVKLERAGVPWPIVIHTKDKIKSSIKASFRTLIHAAHWIKKSRPKAVRPEHVFDESPPEELCKAFNLAIGSASSLNKKEKKRYQKTGKKSGITTMASILEKHSAYVPKKKLFAFMECYKKVLQRHPDESTLGIERQGDEVILALP